MDRIQAIPVVPKGALWVLCALWSVCALAGPAWAQDTTPPYTANHNPLRFAQDVLRTTGIALDILDEESGVNASTIILKVNGQAVNPTTSPTSGGYHLTYQPAAPFGWNERVNIDALAQDVAGNQMNESYWFKTEGGTTTPSPTPTPTPETTFPPTVTPTPGQGTPSPTPTHFEGTPDYIRPFVNSWWPPKWSRNNDQNVIVAVQIHDSGSGVDASTIVLSLDQSPVVADVQDLTGGSYGVSYKNPGGYAYSQVVEVKIEACDFGQPSVNCLNELPFSFTIRTEPTPTKTPTPSWTPSPTPTSRETPSTSTPGPGTPTQGATATPTPTAIGGAITTDTVWSRAASPYFVGRNTFISDGATLTIEPGVLIRLAEGIRITVNGGLVALGTAQDPITFTSDDDNGGPAFHIWNSLTFGQSAASATFDGEGHYNGGSALVHCRFRNAQTAIIMEGSAPYIANNTFSECSNPTGTGAAITVSRLAQPVIEGNMIVNNVAGAGTAVFINNGGPTIRNNTIVWNRMTSPSYPGAAIHGFRAVNPRIQDNSILYNDGDAVNLESGTLEGNTFMENSGRGLVGVGMEAHQNHLMDNGGYEVEVTKAENTFVQENWWGTGEADGITAEIYDRLDKPSLGIASYEPFLQTVSYRGPMPPPRHVTANTGLRSVTVSWDAPAPSGVVGYEVHYGDHSGLPYGGTGALEGSSPIWAGGVTEFTLTGLIPGKTYYFSVITVGSGDRRSYYSREASVQVLGDPQELRPVILLGGYWDTFLTSAEGGQLKLLAVITDPQGLGDMASGAVTVIINGLPTGVFLKDDGQSGDFGPGDSIYGFMLDVPGGASPIRAPLVVKAFDSGDTPSLSWPYFTVE